MGPVAKDTMVITRVAEGRHWHALDDDLVVGRGHALYRPDGRVFLSVDSWHQDAFYRLAEVMLADLPAPLYTVVDDDDHDAVLRWQRMGFVTHRREREYAVPAAGPRAVAPPPGVIVLPAGHAEEAPLRALDRALRDEVGPVGWQAMPAEVWATGVVDPYRYVVAVRDGEYVGLARVAPIPRRPRLGLIAVRAAHRRLGVARTMLAEVLGAAHRAGAESVAAEVDSRNTAALALFEGFGAKHLGDAVELVRR